MNNEEKILEILGQMQTDISGLKEGQTSLKEGQKILEQGQYSLVQGQKILEQGQKSLEQRQISLEQRQMSLEQRQISLEQKQEAMQSDMSAMKESLEVVRESVINIELNELPRIQAALDGVASATERGRDNEKRITQLERKAENLEIRMYAAEAKMA